MSTQDRANDTSTMPPASTTNHERPSEDLHPLTDAYEYMRAYAREKPDVCALWCFGIGFVLGWKLKPW